MFLDNAIKCGLHDRDGLDSGSVSMALLKIFVLLLAVWLGLRWFARKNLYFPERQFYGLPGAYGMSYEDVYFRASDRVQLNGWFIPTKGPLTLLLCHGNAGNISHRVDKIFRFHELGASVFVFDYRGYGKSRGRPSEEGLYRDGEAAYQYLVETRKLPPDHILLYGESLGCAVAVELARHHPARALILESPFTSTIGMANHYYPWLPARWLLRDHYDSLAKMPEIRLPLLLMHSRQDEIVPFSMGQRLFAAATGDKTFFEMVGGHNDGYFETGERYVQAIRHFLVHLAETSK
jgi:hypothetical protein